MRNNTPVTQVNRDYPDRIHIVSTTTEKGVIGYANNDFVEVSGFSLPELEGQAHNIVRHPDMPQAAFKDLWDTLKAGKPWIGLVKNRCKNGDHYWVDAFIAPSVSDKGYQSVRVKPSREHVESAERTYKKINAGSMPDTQFAPRHWSLFTKVAVSVLVALAPTTVTVIAGYSGGAALGALGVSVVLGFGLAAWISGPFKVEADASLKIYDNLVSRLVYGGRNDELGQLKTAHHFLINKMETVVWRIQDSVGMLQSVAQKTATLSTDSEKQIRTQQGEIEQIATAMNEMSATIDEVARNSSAAADSMNSVERLVGEGAGKVNGTITSVDQLVNRLSDASNKVEEVSSKSENISTLVESIQNIAEHWTTWIAKVHLIAHLKKDTSRQQGSISQSPNA